EALIHQIEGHIERGRAHGRRCPPGDEFHFCRAKSFVLPTSLHAATPEAFVQMLPDVSKNSVAYHYLEARLRLGRPSNDFSDWLAALGENSLAESINALNPYAVTLDELKA